MASSRAIRPLGCSCATSSSHSESLSAARDIAPCGIDWRRSFAAASTAETSGAGARGVISGCMRAWSAAEARRPPVPAAVGCADVLGGGGGGADGGAAALSTATSLQPKN